MDTIFDVLADPVRRRILDLLRERPHLVGELATRLNVSQPSTSKHLRVLREAGLVQAHQDAQRRWYELRAEPLAEIEAWLRCYHHIKHEALDQLNTYLATMNNDDSA